MTNRKTPFMKIVVSPAKSLDFESKLPTTKHSLPLFMEEAVKLNAFLEKKSKKALAELMSISDKLAELNYERYKTFNPPFTTANACQAVFAFSGDVYIGLDAYTLPKDKID